MLFLNLSLFNLTYVPLGDPYLPIKGDQDFDQISLLLQLSAQSVKLLGFETFVLVQSVFV